MENTKWFALSKTLWGAIIAILPILGPQLGLHLTDNDVHLINQNADDIVSALGAIVVVIDRVVNGYKQPKKLTVIPKQEKIWPPRRRR